MGGRKKFYFFLLMYVDSLKLGSHSRNFLEFAIPHYDTAWYPYAYLDPLIDRHLVRFKTSVFTKD